MRMPSLRNIIIASTVFAVAACSDNEPTRPGQLKGPSFLITPPSGTLYEADTLALTTVYRDSTGAIVPGGTITWSTSDTSLAVFTDGGKLVALKSGTVKVKAVRSGTTAEHNLIIVRPTIERVEVMLGRSLIARGDLLLVGVQLHGPGGRLIRNRAVTFTSDNPAIATMESPGRFRGVAPGVVTIRAVSEGLTGTAQLTVRIPDLDYELHMFNGQRLPIFLNGDTVMWNGRKEYHELWVETGKLELFSNPLNYRVRINFYQYHVVVENGVRKLIPVVPQSTGDNGTFVTNPMGDLQMTSEVVHPLSHTATPFASPTGGGLHMNYRIGGTDEYYQLRFRREPQ